MKCRHCEQPLPAPFLDLGTAPPSNAYLRAEQLDQPELWFPLRLHVCEDCWLVQTADFAGREELFTPDYAYFSSTSVSWLEHARAYSEQVCARFALGTESKVVEIAANDGYLLQYFRERGVPCYGVEPTSSTANAARARGIEIVESFFGISLACKLRTERGPADLIIANNVLAHVPDINDFVAGFSKLLAPHGVATFEFPHVLRLVQGHQFDTVYHEHYSYLSLGTVQTIFRMQGLHVFDVDELSTHGGSLRVYAQRSETPQHYERPTVNQLLMLERQAGCFSGAFYARLQQSALSIKSKLLDFLLQAQTKKLKVAAFGAAAKGNTLLNYCGVRSDLVQAVYDTATAKQGRFLPGSRIPIFSPELIPDHRPDVMLILPWNLHKELRTQLSFLRDWGARLVVAVPAICDVTDKPSQDQSSLKT